MIYIRAHDHLPATCVQAFMDLINRMDEYSGSHELHETMDYVIRQSGLIPHHEKEGGES